MTMASDDLDIEEETGEHDLALGNTRPPVFPFLNIPWTDFVIFVLAALQAFAIRPAFLIPIGIAFLSSIALYRKDYNAGRCFFCWVLTDARHLSARTFDGPFISPDRISPLGSYRGIIGS